MESLDENFYNSINWTYSYDLSLYDDVFIAFGKLRIHAECEDGSVIVLPGDTKTDVYERIKAKFGKTSKGHPESATCFILGDGVKYSSIEKFIGTKKFIRYTDFSEWLSQSEIAHPKFIGFTQKYKSSIDNLLRPYQQVAKDRIFKEWSSKFNILLQMPTGTGKTVLFSSIIHDLNSVMGSKVLIIAHRKELIEQVDSYLHKYNIEHGLIISGRKKELDKNIQVASIQTITHVSNIAILSQFSPDFIIIDEAHHSLANSYKKLWEICPMTWKLGVTATPYRLNKASFTPLFDILITSMQTKEFINQGYLSKYRYFVDNPKGELVKAIRQIKDKSSTGDYKTSELLENLNVPVLIKRLITCYLTYAKGLKGIVYAISIEHAINICNAYKGIGVSCLYIDNNTPPKERIDIINRFRNNEIQVLVNVEIFTEGFDCPDVDFIQMARPTYSYGLYLQQVGRGLRFHPDKQNAIILDNAGMFEKFGLPSDEIMWTYYFNGDSDYIKENAEDRAINNKTYLDSSHSSKLMIEVDTNKDYQERNTGCLVGFSNPIVAIIVIVDLIMKGLVYIIATIFVLSFGGKGDIRKLFR